MTSDTPYLLFYREKSEALLKEERKEKKLHEQLNKFLEMDNMNFLKEKEQMANSRMTNPSKMLDFNLLQMIQKSLQQSKATLFDYDRSQGPGQFGGRRDFFGGGGGGGFIC